MLICNPYIYINVERVFVQGTKQAPAHHVQITAQTALTF